MVRITQNCNNLNKCPKQQLTDSNQQYAVNPSTSINKQGNSNLPVVYNPPTSKQQQIA
jgi:hypothetical protein